MWLAVAVQGGGLTVGADHGIGLGHDILDVLLAHSVVDLAHSAPLLHNQVKAGVGRIHAPDAGDLQDGFAHGPLVFFCGHIGDEDVPPTAFVAGVDTLSGLRVLETGQQALHAALKGPEGGVAVQGGGGRAVGVLVQLHVQPLAAGLVHQGNGGLAVDLPDALAHYFVVGDL